jgi:hypothetical protein
LPQAPGDEDAIGYLAEQSKWHRELDLVLDFSMIHDFQRLGERLPGIYEHILALLDFTLIEDARSQTQGGSTASRNRIGGVLSAASSLVGAASESEPSPKDEFAAPRPCRKTLV